MDITQTFMGEVAGEIITRPIPVFLPQKWRLVDPNDNTTWPAVGTLIVLAINCDDGWKFIAGKVVVASWGLVVSYADDEYAVSIVDDQTRTAWLRLPPVEVCI